MNKEVNTFKYLWKLVNEVKRAEFDDKPTGTIVGRYASMFDDRLENSGHSRSVDSLKLYSTEQLEEELKERKQN